MTCIKRTYNWNIIIESARFRDFPMFDMWILKPEAHIIQDDPSRDFLALYTTTRNEKHRELLMEALKEEDGFYHDLSKCIKVVTNPDNVHLHQDVIHKYLTSFRRKWGEEIADKYSPLFN